METTVSRARRLAGEVAVPGELEPAQRRLLLASLSTADSRMANVPAAAGPLIRTLEQLGVQIEADGRYLCIRGSGPRTLRAEHCLDGRHMGAMRPALLGLLAGQPGCTRLSMGGMTAEETALLERLQDMGLRVSRNNGDTLMLEGGDGLAGREHDVEGLSAWARLGLILASLSASGATTLIEPAEDRSRLERLLRHHGISVDTRRDADTGRIRLTLNGGSVPAPVDTDLNGDLDLAYPFMVMAAARRGSKLRLRRLSLRPAKRGFLDLLRHVGVSIELQRVDGDVVDITVDYSRRLKSTRVAGQRASRVIGHFGLVAILATQCPGEFVIRDVQELRAGPVDQVAHVVSLLKSLGVRVGEYPEGLVVQGGGSLGGAVLDSLGLPGLAFACVTAGALAHGQTTITGMECLQAVYPDFLETLDSIRE